MDSQIWATERVKDETSDWALASRAHFRGAYLFGLLAFVLFSLMFESLMSSFVFPFARPLTVYKHFVFFWSSEKKKQQHKRINPWECWIKKKKMLPFLSINKKKSATQHFNRMKIYCATFRTLGLNSVVLFCLTLLISWTIWSLYVLCWLYIYFFLYIKKKRKEKKT